MRSNTEHPIYTKISEGTVTVDDFNQLIQEAMPESVRDRVRRRVKRNETDPHQDIEGHQQLALPTFADRIEPKRKPAGDVQMHGRGKIAHKHSARTQKRTMPKRFAEAFEFISTNIGTPESEYRSKLQLVEDKIALTTLASRMMGVPNIDRDWLFNLRTSISSRV